MPRIVLPVVSRSKFWLLVFIALIALAEKGPPVVGIPQGASPFNIWSLGTFDFYNTLKRKYPNTTVITSTAQLDFPDGYEYCLFIAISPEIPYSKNEAELIVSKLSKCRKPALLIADEFETSNVILETAGLPARVAGSMIYTYSERGGEHALSPYVKAVFTLGTGEMIVLTLDRASYVEGGLFILGYAENVVVHDMARNTWTARERVPVAIYSSNEYFRSIVISDGSIFLNQVLRSKYGGEYSRLLLYFVEYLCGFDRNCAVVIDGSKYRFVDAENMFMNAVRSPQTTPIGDILLAGLLYAVKLAHPSTWLVPLMSFFNVLAQYFLNVPPVSYMFLLTIIVITSSYILRKVEERSRDERVREVEEVELYVTADLVNAITRGKYRLTRTDFASLYEIVDAYLKYALGYGLLDRDVVNVLSKYIGYKKAVKYVTSMNKLYLKATGRKRLPVVLSWHRTVQKYIRVSEEVLKSIGYSLESEKGYEYIAMVRRR